MKKAIAVTELMIILLAIAAGIGLLVLTKQTTEKTSCKQAVDLCRQSFLFFKRVKEKSGSLGIAPRIDCIAVSPPNCGQKQLKADGSSEERKRKTMFVIAENLRWCWHKTLGRDNTVGEDFGEAGFLPRWGKEDDVDFCLVCSEFIMPDDVSITKEEWNAYLSGQRIAGETGTYADFIQPVGDEIWGKRYRDIGFSAGQQYYVVSVSAEESRGDGQVYIYADREISCGDEDPQVHYQLK